VATGAVATEAATAHEQLDRATPSVVISVQLVRDLQAARAVPVLDALAVAFERSTAQVVSHGSTQS